MNEINKKPNRLANEKSPYLLQHAYNPVDWHPWGDEAFELAREENKPVFLSIGYSTCHWCHVMERESFEDEYTAGLMNKAFISIKVDREERPDIDSIYMNVCQMLTGAGGWPLTILLTPDRKPFYAATYIPRKTMWGRIGMDELIPRISKIWQENKMTLIQTSNDITDRINSGNFESKGNKPDKSIFKKAFDKLTSTYDEINGGFGSAPKFPMPHTISFLINYWKHENQPKALEMAVRTLEAMRNGGLFDHIGYGFHRYSTDTKWLVPHFEKMLYDQALLIIAYSEAYEAAKNQVFGKVAEETIGYVSRELASPEGAFYSAEDADSEGIEGKFYLWMNDELNLSGLDSDFIRKALSIEPGGNFHDEAGHSLAGSNIPHFAIPPGSAAADLGMDEAEFSEKLEASRKILFKEREKRVRPFRDDKILADWNGLMIAALSKASSVTGRKEYSEAAEKAYDFIKTNMIDSSGRIRHRYRNGDNLAVSTLDDYAFLVWGLAELYEATFDINYLKDAVELTDIMAGEFYDYENGGFYLASNIGENLISRPKELYDGAIPSGNSIALRNMLFLYKITGDVKYYEIAEKTIMLFNDAVSQYPPGYTAYLNALYMLLGSSAEIVVCGNRNSEDTLSMLELIREKSIPNSTVILKTPENEDSLSQLAPFTKSMYCVGGRATAYICTDFACSQPVNEIELLRDALEQSRSKYRGISEE